ncbi:MAG: GNAT family N-acetyltransferase [Actinomycetota bacterium]|nr:GNAT family N-acetyltransferase [Actinomycetota bacterium]
MAVYATPKENMGFEVILQDGKSLRIRAIAPEDKRKLEEFFYRLSPQTRYFRFHYAKEKITAEELAYFTEVNPPKRVAFVATIGEGEAERIVGVGRWDIIGDGKTAEISFVVEDRLQVRGVGTALIEQLAGAANKFKIKKFVANVLPENTRMLKIFDESGFKLDKNFHEGVYVIEIDLEEQEEFEKRQLIREHMARSAGVKRLLYPRSVAVIGASRDPESVGGAVFRNLLEYPFNGPVFPVNPNASSVAGVLSYPSVTEIPSNIDLAVIVVPAKRVIDVVDECGKKGVAGLVIISAGFGESDGEGKERERLLKEKVLSYGMRVIGPNCLGIFNGDADVQINATFSPIRPPKGRLSIGSQSGALGLALLDYSKDMNLGISKFVSIGNRLDISSNDLIEFFEDDEETDVILLYLESFGNSRRFSQIARRVSRKKPIIAVKSGRSAVGARAASSHTGALAASEVAVEAMFKKSGVIRVSTIENMFNVAEVLVNQPLPKGPRVAVLTNAGGPGVLAADACEGWGLVAPPLSQETQKKLREFLPKEAAVTNPVDMIASAEPASYRKALKVILEDKGIDSVIMIYIPPLVTHPEEVAAEVKAAMEGYKGEKPVIACFMMSRSPSVDLKIDEARYVPSFIFPENAVGALARAYQYAKYKEAEEGKVVKFDDINAEGIRARFLEKMAVSSKEGNWLMPEVAAELLEAYGIPIAKTGVAASEEEAATLAKEIGFPVVMKIRSDTITHKTDVGGIVLNLKNEKEVKEAFKKIREKMKSLGQLDEMMGVIIQPMLADGQEVIVGMSLDPTFGPLIMLGLGGTYVELIKDVAFAIHPLTDIDPKKMLAQLKGSRLLTGWRGSKERDIISFCDIILRFSVMISDFPEIDQAEMNPVMVFDKGRGCAVVDARIYVKSDEVD